MSYLRTDSERTVFLKGQVAQVIGDYLVCLERYAEAREEYQLAEQIYQKIPSTSADYQEAKKNREIIQQYLETLPNTQKSCQDYQLEILFAPENKQAQSSIKQPLNNLNEWLENLLDQGWQIIDNLLGNSEANLAYAYGLRSSNFETLEEIDKKLKAKGLEIPATTFKAFRDLTLGEYALRLSIQTWWNLTQKNALEWTVLLVLGMNSEEVLPAGLTLQVSDLTQTLVERKVVASRDETYLYACVVGSWDEQFIVAIALENGDTLTLSPLGFKNLEQ